jgi:hypothetical protein
MSGARASESGGERLFAIVESYARIGHHRTGTAEGRATLDWFERELASRGGATSRWSFAYSRYDWSASLSVAGAAIDTVPLYYEGEGSVATEQPFLRAVQLANNYDKRDIAAALAEAKAAKARLALLATSGVFGDATPTPSLIGTNVDPDLPTSGTPTLLVSAEHLPRLRRGSSPRR